MELGGVEKSDERGGLVEAVRLGDTLLVLNIRSGLRILGTRLFQTAPTKWRDESNQWTREILSMIRWPKTRLPYC